MKVDFYGKGFLDTPFYIKRWLFNLKFPFVHRTVKRYTVLSAQKELNKLKYQQIMRLLKDGKIKILKRKTSKI